MYTVKFDIVIAALKTLTICTWATLEEQGMKSVKVLDDQINTRINHIQYYLTEGLIIFWNWFLELKMYKRHLYYLFFYCFNLITLTLLASLYYIDVLFFLAVFKIDLLAHFSS